MDALGHRNPISASLRLLATTFVLLSVLLGGIGSASAHASLVSTEPHDGSVLEAAPKMVQLRFNEPIAPAVVQLIDARGRVRTDAVVRASDDLISIVVPDGIPDGTQVVSYRIISADGHPVSGALVFSIGAVTGAAATDVAQSTPVIGTLTWLARWGLYLGLFVGIGGVWFRTWIAPGREGATPIRAALLVGLLSAVAGLGLQGLDLLGLPLMQLATPAPWRAALATTLGPSLLLAIGALVAAAVSERYLSSGIARGVSGLALIGVGASLAASGHASTASPQWLMRSSVFIHGICVAYWVGALLPLLGMLRRPTGALLPVLQRFSRCAVVAVALLVLTGGTIAVVQLERLGALFDTAYGQLLTAKLLLVLALLGLAGLNRWRLTPRLARGLAQGGTAQSALWRSVAGEVVIVLAILAVVAGWRFTPPPRALAAVARTELSVHLHTDKGMVQVTITPGTTGSNTFDLQFMNEDLTPLKIVDASITLTQPSLGIEPLSRPAQREADDRWVVHDVPLPFAGRWRVRVEGFISDFDKLSVEDAFEVP